MTASAPREDTAVERQAQLYGAPFAALTARLSAALGMSQAAMARTIGISAPMMSQLVGAQRVRLGNPLALQRLQSLLALADEVDDGLPASRVAERIAEVSTEAADTLNRHRSTATAPDELAIGIAGVLQAIASRREISASADLLRDSHPALAAFLRAYGLGSSQAARDHLAAVRHLL